MNDTQGNWMPPDEEDGNRGTVTTKQPTDAQRDEMRRMWDHWNSQPATMRLLREFEKQDKRRRAKRAGLRDAEASEA